MQEEEEAKERKNKKRAAKLQRKAERIAEMDKRLELKLALRTDDFFEKIEANLGPVIELARQVQGKNKGISQPASASGSGSDSGDSATEDIRRQTRNQTIRDKRKRGPEPVFEGNPPMITPTKRTPQTVRGKRVTTTCRVKPKSQLTTKLSPYMDKRKGSPGSTIAKLKFRNKVIDEIRGLDAQELQAICKAEGVPYHGKIESIFDIASYRTRVEFGEIQTEEASNLVEIEDEVSTTLEDNEPESKA
ncbi:hypothetical protein CBR_g36444 [Chara braunii]|uniref:Uncharacterized protein n=1 Tax=Chara braunii TaxID=69332 RepID=A0A388LKW0_CHABU|nr:hypothetical protein CBR_g36444 [Chara braunii]|eukprot:GBG82917.1 hypothetical protein CBR_g36444 [Chara braunii]